LFLAGVTAAATIGHTHGISADDNIPEYKRIVFIMKT